MEVHDGKRLQIIETALPMTGKAVRKGSSWLVEWANGDRQRILATEVAEKDGVLWVESAKKAELVGKIKRARIMIRKVKRDLKRGPKDTIKQFTLYGWRKYLSTLKKGLAKIDKKEKVHRFIEDRVCQRD